jgi:NDP-sugar pyrophosphorylase family protein
MKAMILAAGLGTRLGPLTDDRPKALVTIAGRTLLEMTLARLRSFGVREVIVNVHHHAEMILHYLKANHNFGMRIEVSHEEDLLDTGGGLKKAAWFFLEPCASAPSAEPIDAAPFLIHNVDVLSAIDLARMAHFHTEHDALVTLAVQDREASRYLLFDEQNQLCGPRGGSLPKDEALKAIGAATGLVETGQKDRARQVQALAFSGIHVVAPRIFSMLQEEGAFSIIDAYLRLASQGEKILGFRADGSYWRDLGRPENLLEAARDLETGRYSQS